MKEGRDLEIRNHWATKNTAMMEIHARLVHRWKITMVRFVARAETKAKGWVKKRKGDGKVRRKRSRRYQPYPKLIKS
jgi:hypothetical protein